jgi:DNA-binding GntR family transcriptional regulator
MVQMSPDLTGDFIPKYVRIANHIRDQIIRGEIKPGDLVPSTRQIMSSWGVSMPTATKVQAALRADGLVEAKPGIGTVVTQPRIIRGGHERHLIVQRSTRISAPATRAEIVESGLVPAPLEVRDVFGLDEADAMALRRRRVTYNGVPRSMSITWTHPEIAQIEPRLTETTDLPDEVVTYVSAATGRQAKLFRERVLARLASAEEARDLQLTQPAAVLVAYHTIYDAEGDVLTYEVSIYPPGRVRYEDEIVIDPRSA